MAEAEPAEDDEINEQDAHELDGELSEEEPELGGDEHGEEELAEDGDDLVQEGSDPRPPSTAHGEQRKTSKIFFSKFEKTVRNKMSQLVEAVGQYKVDELRQHDPRAGRPSALGVVVFPTGKVDVRVSDWLMENELVHKYLSRFLWALRTTFIQKQHAATEQDLGLNDTDNFPPEFHAKKDRERASHYNNRLKTYASDVIRRKREALGLAKFEFCPPKDRGVCNGDHDCKERRERWGWPPHVPFIHTSHMTQEQMKNIITHYDGELPRSLTAGDPRY